MIIFNNIVKGTNRYRGKYFTTANNTKITYEGNRSEKQRGPFDKVFSILFSQS